MSAFRKPPQVDGDDQLIRIGLPLLRQEPDACPAGRALRARPLLTQQPDRSRRKPVEDFPFAPWGNFVDSVEHRGKSLAEAVASAVNVRRCSEAHVLWAAEAAGVYLAARAREQSVRVAAGHLATCPVQQQWVGADQLRGPDGRGADRYERTAWGRQYASEDGSLREIWIPSIDCVKRDRPMPEIAAAAYVAASGVPADIPYGKRAQLPESHSVLPQRVRVVGVGLGDGGTQVLADWDATEARRQFDEHAKELMSSAADGHELRPGQDCVRCEALSGCAAVPRVPGLLGVPASLRPRKRRSVSVSDLRAYRDCPARYYLTRVLKLRERRTENAAIRRGRAVDAWLNERHAATPATPCRQVSLPKVLPGLSAEELPSAVAMIRHHRGRCPFDGLAAEETVEPQRRLAVYDQHADVVVIADCDLVHTDRGGVVVRETKTASHRFGERQELVRTYPQLALAVLLMASGALGGDPRRSRIELEVLREDGARLEEVDPFDAVTLDQSRRVITELAAEWAADETYSAAPAHDFDCADCEARRWCTSARTPRVDGARRTGEILR
ncbi:PD-(D/E)XK nuclease family protein [Streptomyces sp. NRRL F-525]|uniref:PD-(D/E)XK nuclease family protein n=1 Tax=Streptomyces sp. NRRL F-525 TaxID=1463861 RepID=UPI000690C5E9|nr:PD-(D/E)XK nuclease family protein [Streptomyces sp. NRRL F-525]